MANVSWKENTKKANSIEPKVIKVQRVSVSMQKEREKQKQIAREKAQKRCANDNSENNNKTKNIQKKKKIELRSDNGIRSNTEDTCDKCGRYAYVWKYNRSSHGKVKLCLSCNQKALNKLYKKVDASYRAYNGGGFSKK